MPGQTNPTRELPDGYVITTRINLKENLGLALRLNLAAFGVLLITGLGLIQLLKIRKPDLFPRDGFAIDLGTSLSSAAIVIVVMVIVLLVHEAIHGFFFWSATGTRPVFGLHLSYAYAAAPDWYIPSLTYLWIGLSPLILIDIGLFLWMMVAPAGLILYLAVAFLMNTSGSVGDLWILYTLLKLRRPTMVRDLGDEVVLYSKPIPD